MPKHDVYETPLYVSEFEFEPEPEPEEEEVEEEEEEEEEVIVEEPSPLMVEFVDQYIEQFIPGEIGFEEAMDQIETYFPDGVPVYLQQRLYDRLDPEILWL